LSGLACNIAICKRLAQQHTANNKLKKLNLLNAHINRILILLSLSLTAGGCGFQSYIAKPIKPNEVIQQLEAQSPESAQFQDYLIAQNYPQNQFPIKEWGLTELTYSALFFHPDLNVARAQWRAAQSSEITATQRPEIGVNAGAQKHSKADGVSPWTYSLGIDVPIVTAGKTEAKIAQARNLSEAARIEIAQTAWQVRARLAKSLLDYQFATQQSAVLTNEVKLRSAIVDMLQKRVDMGMASNTELSTARIALQKAEQALNAEQGRIPSLQANLASNAGLPLTSFKQLVIKNTANKASPVQTDLLQYEALLNRLDIRAALARFDAAEAKLRLEILKQYPDLTLSPSRVFDQGDQIWSLGFSSLLSLVNKNRGLIAEATAQREVQIAQFEALQAKVIGDLNQTKADYLATLESQEKASAVLLSQQKRTQRTQQQFEAGFSDKLALVSAELENLTAEQNVLQSGYKVKIAKLALEDTIQHPLDDFNMPQNPESVASGTRNE
jgi:outer membrane protein TolC